LKRFTSWLISILIICVTFSGCSKLTKDTSANQNVLNKQKVIVVVTDKETKEPIKDSKVYIAGDNTAYTTDGMGKTPEISVELNKDYFNKYLEEVYSKMQCGFANVIAVKDGYGKHMELDYTIFPGDSPTLIKIEMAKNKKYTYNINKPDILYADKLLKSYEKFDGEGNRSESMMKYKISVTDESNKLLENVKIVIPEAKLTGKTDKKGVVELNIPYDESYFTNYPVKKDFSEMTVLLYKDGYASKAVFKVCVYKDSKKNLMTIKIKKASKPELVLEIAKPSDKWLEEMANFYLQ
jgi:hypothetical protein